MRMELLYGYWYRHDSLCVARAQHVRTLSEEHTRVQACTTVGDLRRVEPTLTRIPLPADLEEFEDEPDETPWDWQADGLGVADGDWPAMPTSLALGDLDDEDLELLFAIEGVGTVATIFNGDYLHIPTEAEQLVVECLVGRGYVVNRDDSVFDWGT